MRLIYSKGKIFISSIPNYSPLCLTRMENHNSNEEQVRAMSKVEKLLKWYSKRTLPPPPIQLEPYLRVNDVQKFVGSFTAILTTAQPLTRGYIAAFNHLLKLKKYIEDHEVK